MVSKHRANDLVLIQVEHTPCFGTCPVYRYTLRADGRATYCGEHFVPKLGVYRGELSLGTFRRLARLLLTHRFKTLRELYDLPVTDMPSVIITVTAQTWMRRVENYGRAGPPRLDLIERALDRACTRIKWRKVRAGAT